MSYRVMISNQAEKDLRAIFSYIAFDLQSLENAEAQLDRLEKQIASLDQFPLRFRRFEVEPWFARGLRYFPVDNYCVFYLPNVETNTVTIIRVLYAGSDMERTLQFTLLPDNPAANA